MSLTNTQKERYARQLMLPDVGPEGQEKLLRARVLLIGGGGLGSPAALYLAAAGVTIGIADADEVSLSNLQRQILHGTPDLGRPKVESAKEAIENLNPDVAVHAYQLYATEDNIAELIEGYDFVLDCTDHFAAKFLINDACVRAGKPFSHAGIDSLQGQLMTYVPGINAPCYRCIFPEPPIETSKGPIGVVGAVAGVIGALQAMEAIKYIAGMGGLLTGRLLCFDAKAMEFHQVRLPRREGCVCGSAASQSSKGSVAPKAL